MFHSNNLRSLFSVLVLAALSGCSITPTHYAVTPPTKTVSGDITSTAAAEAFPKGKVGWGRVTLFAIPVVPIHVHGDGAALLMDHIQEALTTTGYHVSEVQNGATSNGPVLHAEVLQYRFNNYTWLVPFVPTWGQIELKASLVKPDGKSVWEHRFLAKGMTWNFTDGYTISAAKCTTRIMQQMVTEFSSDQFVTAMAQAR